MSVGLAADLPPPHGLMASPQWYRVQALKPRLAPQARLHRHHYRGQTWFLLHDPAGGRVHRFTPSARFVIAAMDGQRSVAQLWQLARAHLGASAPSQEELVALLGQLHGADLLVSDNQPDVLELLDRGDRQRARERAQAWRNPLALKLRLWDPGRFLDRHAALWRLLWGRPGALLWLALVLPALALLPTAWPVLSDNLSDRVLQPGNLLQLALVLPLLKLLHEMGHASATHARGGEVHDMGLVLLVGMPVPYVDASAASVLRSRWSRALVGAAGMAVELAIAAAAFLLWRQLEPGTARALCFNTMLAAGVATLLFNGNPLLRYDAYHILGDVLELPNLAQRAQRLWSLGFQRHVLRLPGLPDAGGSPAEQRWLLAWGLLSTVYRAAVTLLLALFVASNFFIVGVLLALLALWQLLLPPLRGAWGLLQQPALRARRGRLLAGAGALAALLAVAGLTVPLPDRTQVEGVVWLPDEATLRADGAGTTAQLLASPGAQVAAGAPLLRRTAPVLQADLARQQARVDELRAQHDAVWVDNRAAAAIIHQQWRQEAAALVQLQARADALLVRAPVAGQFLPQQGGDILGRHHAAGEVLGHVLDPLATRRVRLLLTQAQAEAAGSGLRAVALRSLGEPHRVLPARVVRRMPAATDTAPAPELLAGNAEALARDPRDPQGLRLLARVFQVDVEPQAGWPRLPAHGERVVVRFDQAPQPLAHQAWAALRRLFLRHFET